MDALKSSYYLDYHHSAIQEIVNDFMSLESQKEKIEQLYVKIRDGWRYSPFKIGLTKQHFVSSVIATKKEAHCIDKAILYISCLRALNIPAKLRLAKVSNHIATERLEAKIGTNELAPHGLVDVFYNNKWVKCSPAFNKELCAFYKVEVLEFDGTYDSVMQEYNQDNKQFMSYLEDYGSFDDVPFDRIVEIFKSNYPKIYQDNIGRDELVIE